ncbi:MAG: GNAT family N-acetyltransferase [Gemmatimonadota bacterium]
MNRPDVRIRSAVLADAPALAALSGQLGYPADPAEMHARLSRILARSTDAVLVAELAGGAVAGWLHVVEEEPLETGPHALILGLVVDAQVRRLAVGRTLVSAAESWTGARGLTTLLVRSNAARVESHPFYEGLGYTRIKTQHCYRKAVSGSPEAE